MFTHTILQQVKQPEGTSPTASPMLTEVTQIAERRLHAEPSLYHHDIRCHFHEGVLTLHGQLPSYYLKQVAQELAAEVDGVLEIANRIEVVSRTYYPIPR